MMIKEARHMRSLSEWIAHGMDQDMNLYCRNGCQKDALARLQRLVANAWPDDAKRVSVYLDCIHDKGYQINCVLDGELSFAEAARDLLLRADERLVDMYAPACKVDGFGLPTYDGYDWVYGF